MAFNNSCKLVKIERCKYNFLYTIVDKLLISIIIVGYSMTTKEDYVERLEKIIDKQDDLLSQLDARFKQQDSLIEILSKENNFLKEDIQKHKNLTRDMHKTVNQQKNVLSKLKKELEDQLKIQQDLHREYGEVIKQLTDDLEEEQNKNEDLIKEQGKLESKIKLLESEIKKLEKDIKAQNDIKDSQPTSYYGSFNQKDKDDAPETQSNKKSCPNCGTEIQEGYLFCESCGTKL